MAPSLITTSVIAQNSSGPGDLYNTPRFRSPPQAPAPIAGSPIPPADAASPAAADDALASWKLHAAAKIASRARYPVRHCGKNCPEGRAMVSFRVDRRGRLSGRIMIQSSSGSGHLDREALTAVRRAAPFDPLPDSTVDQTLNVLVPIRFRL